ncbi:MAG TPA: restriction endonuclease subunit S [Candidatus Obscuribacterales bacterium]
MDLKTFFEQFDTIAEAPGGIQRLRNLILDMAVRGKLVPQDPDDEPAVNLLHRIQIQKQKLIEVGEVPKPNKIKTEKNELEHLFDLPEKWTWTCLDTVSSYIQRGKSPKYADSGKVLVISQKCIQWTGFELDKSRHIEDETISSYGKERFLQPGDLLWNSTGTGTVGRINVFPNNLIAQKVVADSHVTVIRSIECLPIFLYYWLSSPCIQSAIEDKTSGTTKQQELNTSTVRLEPVPLPPLAEQKRIVAKVDELMGLCDQFEAEKQQRDSLRQRLRASAFDALMNAPTDDALSTAWSFIHQHWHPLTQHPDDVKDVRRSLLQLAVRGRLSYQEDNDGHAQDHLKAMIQEKVQLIKEKRIRATKALADLDLESMPFKLPKNWSWAYIQDVGEVKLGRQRSPKNHSGAHMVPYLRVANVLENQLNLSDVKTMNFSPEEQEIFRLQKFDILLNEGQSYELVGRPAMYRDEIPGACFQNTLVRFRAFSQLMPDYALLVFRGYMHNGRFQDKAQQTTNIAHLSVGRLLNIEFPLPPLAEQKRIVAKVDELMRECDQLEAQLRQQQQVAEQFAASAVSHLVV